MRRYSNAFLSVVVVALLAAPLFGGPTLEIAEELIVDLNASHASAGTATWINEAGAAAADDFGVIMGTPTVGDVDGTTAVTFDGNSVYQMGVAAPATLTGLEPSRSIEVWAYNPTVDAEENMVAWGHRGDPCGSSMGFNFAGLAVTHWCHDLGWEPHPPAAQWTHLVYSYNGFSLSVYENGVIKNSRLFAADQIIDTFEDGRITIAAQLDGDGVTPADAPYRGSLSIAQVRVHGGALSAAQVLTNFDLEKGNYNIPETAPTFLVVPGDEPIAKGSITHYVKEIRLGGFPVGTLEIFDGPAGATLAEVFPRTFRLEYPVPAPNPDTVDFTLRATNSEGMTDASWTITFVGLEPTDPLQVAGELFVDLKPNGFDEGAGVWTNDGTLGDFDTIYGNPFNSFLGGAAGVEFDGVSAVQGELAPAGLTGSDTRTVEVWAFNPDAIAPEETLVTWGRRGGPALSVEAFLYAGNAIVHWDQDDLNWNGPVPAYGEWHHLAYTYDGVKSRIYSDGVLVNTGQDVTLVTKTDSRITVGSQLNDVDTGEPGGLGEELAHPNHRYTGSIAQVRIHDGVLEEFQIKHNHDKERSLYEGGLQVAGELFVDLKPDGFDQGAGVWTNDGTLGDFDTVYGNPVNSSEGGSPGVSFDGLSGIQGELAPANLTGSSDRTVEVWAFNPSDIEGEETMVTWARRGGPDLSNESFLWDGTALVHWAADDLGWGAVPAYGEWHHLTYTYDGDRSRIYDNGELINQGNPGTVLATKTDSRITVGSQLNDNDTGEPGGLGEELAAPAHRFSGLIAQVRIHDGVLADAQIRFNHDLERPNYLGLLPSDPIQVAGDLLVDLRGNGFDEGAGVWANDGTLGDFDTIYGNPVNSSEGGSQGVSFDGLSAIQGELPPAGITGSSSRTVEVWAFNPSPIQPEETLVSWARRGAPGLSVEAFLWAGNAVVHWDADDLNWAGPVPVYGQWHHLAYTHDGQSRIYVDGVLVNTGSPVTLVTKTDSRITVGSQLNDVDIPEEPGGLGEELANPNHRYSGLIGQVRIHNDALTSSQIAHNYNKEISNYTPRTVWNAKDDFLEGVDPPENIGRAWSYRSAEPPAYGNLLEWDEATNGGQYTGSLADPNLRPFVGEPDYGRSADNAENEIGGHGAYLLRWTSPIDGVIAINGYIYSGDTGDRKLNWQILKNDVLLTEGFSPDSGPGMPLAGYANRQAFTEGSGGAAATTEIAVSIGDTIDLAALGTDGWGCCPPGAYAVYEISQVKTVWDSTADFVAGLDQTVETNDPWTYRNAEPGDVYGDLLVWSEAGQWGSGPAYMASLIPSENLRPIYNGPGGFGPTSGPPEEIAKQSGGHGAYMLRWTSPMDGFIDINGYVYSTDDVDRKLNWQILKNDILLTEGFSPDDGGGANPAEGAIPLVGYDNRVLYEDGSGGANATTSIEVSVGDTIDFTTLGTPEWGCCPPAANHVYVISRTEGPPQVRVEPGDDFVMSVNDAPPDSIVTVAPGTYEASGSIFRNSGITIVAETNGGAAGDPVSAVVLEFPVSTDWTATIQPGVAQLYENATINISGIHFKVDVTGLASVLAPDNMTGGISILKKSGGPDTNVTVEDCIFEYVGTPLNYNVFNAQLVRFEGGGQGNIRRCHFKWDTASVAPDDFGSFENNLGMGGAGALYNVEDCIFDSVATTNGKFRSIGAIGGDADINIRNCLFRTDNNGQTSQQAWISAAAGNRYAIDFCDFEEGAGRQIGHDNVSSSVVNGCIFFSGGDAFLPDPNSTMITVVNSVLLDKAGGSIRSAVFCCENEVRAYTFRHCTFVDNDDQILFKTINFAPPTEFSNCVFNMPNNSTVIVDNSSPTAMAPSGGNNLSNGGGGDGEAAPGLTVVGDLRLEADGYHLTECSPALGSGAVGLSAGLVAHYKFVEDASDSAGSFDGTLSGNAQVTGGSLVLDGDETSYAEVAAFNLNTNTATLTAWVQADGIQGPFTGILYSQGATTVAGINFEFDNQLGYHWNDQFWPFQSGLTVPSDNTRTFVAVVVEADQATLYMQPEGGAMSSAVSGGAHAEEAWDSVSWIGQGTPSQPREMVGSVDEVRVYDRSLGADEVALLAAAPSNDVDVDGEARPRPGGSAADIGADELDGDGPSGTCDFVAPMITCSGNVEASDCDLDSEAVVNFDAPTVSDDVSMEANITVVCDPASGSTFAEGDTVVICTATDEAGNMAECSFTVTVVCGGSQRPGDYSQDGNAADITDGITVLELVILGTSSGGLTEMPCGSDFQSEANKAAHDINLDGLIDITDGIYLLEFLILGSAPPMQGLDCIQVSGCPDSCIAP